MYKINGNGFCNRKWMAMGTLGRLGGIGTVC